MSVLGCSFQWLWFRVYKDTLLQWLDLICTIEPSSHVRLNKLQDVGPIWTHLNSCCIILYKIQDVGLKCTHLESYTHTPATQHGWIIAREDDTIALLVRSSHPVVVHWHGTPNQMLAGGSAATTPPKKKNTGAFLLSLDWPLGTWPYGHCHIYGSKRSCSTSIPYYMYINDPIYVSTMLFTCAQSSEWEAKDHSKFSRSRVRPWLIFAERSAVILGPTLDQQTWRVQQGCPCIIVHIDYCSNDRPHWDTDAPFVLKKNYRLKFCAGLSFLSLSRFHFKKKSV